MQGFDKIPPAISDRRGDNGENQRWLLAAIFVDRPEPFSGVHN